MIERIFHKFARPGRTPQRIAQNVQAIRREWRRQLLEAIRKWQRELKKQARKRHQRRPRRRGRQ